MSSGSDKSFPRLLWKEGVTNLSELTASAKVGIMFTIVVISLTDDGIHFFEQAFKSNTQLNNMHYVFQLLLCYWMWLKKDHYWKHGNKAAREAARQAIEPC